MLLSREYELQRDVKPSEDRFSHEGRSSEEGARDTKVLGREGYIRPYPQKIRGQAQVYPACRPAVRERRYPYRPRLKQDAQGHSRQIQDDARLRLALSPGMGLPRPSGRARPV